MRVWAHDLRIGVWLSASGGHGSRLRSALTALGVSLGVALLLGAASLPHILSARSERNATLDARIGEGPTRLLMLSDDTTFHGRQISGFAVQSASGRAPSPPGIARLPRPGQMVVSPALAKLLASPGGSELRARLHARVTGTIGSAGLTSPAALSFYRGSGTLRGRAGTLHVRGFGTSVRSSQQPAVVTFLIILMLVAMLLPVAVFVATAARFGAEERDRRLAAIRLVGADARSTARIAAGESLPGALAGLLGGALLFLALRPLSQQTSVAGVSVFTSWIRPSPLLGALVVVLVPSASVLATLFGMRHVVTDPLGVSRRVAAPRRRIWWRVLPPIVGFGLLASLIGSPQRLGSTTSQVVASLGLVLILIGITAMLPWVVGRVVKQLRWLPVAGLLGVRRLQVDQGTSSRVVAVVGLAVAGAIALQMVFSAAAARERQATGIDLSLGSTAITLQAAGDDGGAAIAQRLRPVPGVRRVFAVALAKANGAQPVTVASCASIATLLRVKSCEDGEGFAINGMPVHAALALLGARRSALAHRLSAAPFRQDPVELTIGDLVLTPAAAQAAGVVPRTVELAVALRPGDRTAERVRDAAAAIDPLAQVTHLAATQENVTFSNLRTALDAGAILVLAMISASLLVSTAEQLRERRRVLSVLSAFGTRASTLAWSVVWQATIPVGGALLLATVIGTALGALLLRILTLRVSFDWGAIGLMCAAGATAVALVTAATLPLLRRLMRPDDLRAE